MTDQPVPQHPDPDDSDLSQEYDVSGFMQQLSDIVTSARNAQDALNNPDPSVTVMKMPQSALNALLSRLGLPTYDDDDEYDPAPWKTLVDSQLEDAQDFLPTAPRMTVLTWLIGDYNLQWARRHDAESDREREHHEEMMCLHLARMVAAARYFGKKKYHPDYSYSSRGHKKTVDLLLLRTAQHRWSDMGDVAAQRLYTLMGGKH